MSNDKRVVIGKTIRALVEKGDKALDKAEQFYKAAGLHLKTLKEQKPSGVTWPAFVKETCGLSQQRSDELIRIADGRTTLEEVRDQTRARVHKSRELTKPMLRNIDDDEDEDEEEFLGPTLKEIEARIDPIWRVLVEFERLVRQRPIKKFLSTLDPREGIDASTLNETIRARDWLSALIENMRASVESCSNPRGYEGCQRPLRF